MVDGCAGLIEDPQLAVLQEDHELRQAQEFGLCDEGGLGLEPLDVEGVDEDLLLAL